MAARKAPPSDLNPANWRREDTATGNRVYVNALSGDQIGNRQYQQHISPDSLARREGITLEGRQAANKITPGPAAPAGGDWQSAVADVDKSIQGKLPGMTSIDAITKWIQKNLPPDAEVMIVAKGKVKTASPRAKGGPGTIDFRTIMAKTRAGSVGDPRAWNRRPEHQMSQFDDIQQIGIMWREAT